MKDYAFDITDALSAPAITFSMAWADMIPKRLFGTLPMARMIACMKKEELATYPEVVIYLYTRSLEAPMHGEWADIYFHVTCKVLEDYFGEDHWKDIQARKELDQYEESQLKWLRREIYNKRRQILKDRIRTEERVEKQAAKEVESKKPKIIQADLFQTQRA
jgi:hypothetical protein